MPTFWGNVTSSVLPADTDVFRTSSGCLKKVMTSYDQTRRLHDVWQKTSDLRRLEGVLFTSSWSRPIDNVSKTCVLRRLEDVSFTTSRRRRIYVVLKTSDLQRLEDIWFMTSWRRLIYDILKTSDLRRLRTSNFRRFEDIWFTTSWRRLIYNFLMTYVKQRLWRKQLLHNVKRNHFFLSCFVWNIDKILSVPLMLVLRYEIL